MKQVKRSAVVLFMANLLSACTYGVAAGGGTGGFGMSIGTGMRF